MAFVLVAAVLLGVIYVLVSRQLGPHFVVGPGQAPIGEPSVEGFELPLPEPGANDADYMWVRTVADTAQKAGVNRTLNNLLWWSGIGLLLSAAVSLGVGWLFAGRALAPVHTITRRARQISAQSLDERVSLEGPHDELREMADTFDGLLDRIQTAFEHERRLVASMSHELRTPLANQKVTLDVALADPAATAQHLREAMEVTRGQASRAERTVEALLVLARVQAGLAEPALHPVDLASLVEQAASETRDGSENLTWSTRIDPATVRGDSALLERAVVNALSNAVSHNMPSGWVDVHLTTAQGRAVLVVANSGLVLTQAEADELELPFRRAGSDRTDSGRGVGLGLTIVREVVDHHDGTLRVRALPRGGLSVEICIPLFDGSS